MQSSSSKAWITSLRSSARSRKVELTNTWYFFSIVVSSSLADPTQDCLIEQVHSAGFRCRAASERPDRAEAWTIPHFLRPCPRRPAPVQFWKRIYRLRVALTGQMPQRYPSRGTLPRDLSWVTLLEKVR